MFGKKLRISLKTKDVLIQIFLLILIYLISLIFPYVYKYVIDNSVEFVSENLYLKIAAIVIFATLAHFIIYLINYIHQIYSNNISFHYISELLNKVLDIKTSDYQKINKSKIMELLNSDISAMYTWIGIKINFPVNVFQIIILLVILFKINVTLTIISICLTPIYFLGNLITKNKITQISKQERVCGDNLFSQMYNIVYKKINIDLNKARDFFRNKYHDAEQSLLSARNKRHIFFIFALEFPKYITTIIPFILLTIGISFVNNGTLTIGELIMYLQYVAMIYEPVSSISNLKAQVDSSSASFDRINDFMDYKNSVSRNIYGETKGLLEIKNAIINNEKEELLYRIDDLVIDKPGLYIVKGDNGTGKTTLFNLLTGVYDSNQIIADKFMICDGLKDNISYMYNPALLFDGTVLENIQLDNDSADERIVDLNNRFKAKDLSYVVKTNPNNLSLGEQQKLFLIRAFYEDKKIIILDEPSANLDFDSKLILRDYINELKKDKYVFIIAHENVFEEIADKIFEIKNNVLTEQK